MKLNVLGKVRVYDPETKSVKYKYKSIEESENIQMLAGVLIIRIEDGLFFGNMNYLEDRLRRLEIFGDLTIHRTFTTTLRDFIGSWRGSIDDCE